MTKRIRRACGVLVPHPDYPVFMEVFAYMEPSDAGWTRQILRRGRRLPKPPEGKFEKVAGRWTEGPIEQKWKRLITQHQTD